VLKHEFDGFVIEKYAMLDGVNPGAHGIFGALCAL